MASAYICDESTTLTVMDTTTGVVTALLTMGVVCYTAAVSPNGAYAAVADITGHVQLVTAATNTIGPVINTGLTTVVAGLAWAPDSSRVYVGGLNGGTTTITWVGAPGTVGPPPMWTPAVFYPQSMVASPDGLYLYFTGANTVSQYVIASGAVNTVPATAFPSFSGSFYDICISANGANLYVSNNNAPAVWPIVISGSTITPGAMITTAGVTFGISLSPDQHTLWVSAGNTVQTVDTAFLSVTNTIGPFGVTIFDTAITPDGAHVWAAARGAHTVVPINPVTFASGTAITIGGFPRSIAILPFTGGAVIPAATISVTVGPVTVSAGGTITGTGTGTGTVTGSGALNAGPLTTTARTSLEIVTATGTVRVGPLTIFAVSGRVGPRLHPVPGFRGRWRLTLHTRTFAPATLNSTIIAELADARGRQLTQTWNTPATLTFTLDGHSPTAALVQELQQDVVAWRWDDQTGIEQPVFRGPICQSEDQLTTESHTVTYICHDYAALLSRRILTSTYTVTNRDQDDIVADLLALAVTARSSSGSSFAPASFLPVSLFTANPAGGLRGFSAARRDRTYYGSQNVGEAFDALAKVQGGYDWDVRPSPVDTTDSLRIFYPAQGVTRTDVALQYGSTVASLTRSVNSADYANYIRVLGNNQSANPTPQFYAERWNPDANTTPAGLWMLGDDAADVTVQATLNDKAQGDLNFDAVLVPSYTLVLTPDAYTWGNPNMGDVVPLIVQSGRLNVNTQVRVLGVVYSIGDDGQEDVALTVSRPATELYQLFAKADRNTKELARR